MVDVIGQLPHFARDQNFERVLREVITLANLLQQFGKFCLLEYTAQIAATIDNLRHFLGIAIAQKNFQAVINTAQWQKAARQAKLLVEQAKYGRIRLGLFVRGYQWNAALVGKYLGNIVFKRQTVMHHDLANTFVFDSLFLPGIFKLRRTDNAAFHQQFAQMTITGNRGFGRGAYDR